MAIKEEEYEEHEIIKYIGGSKKTVGALSLLEMNFRGGLAILLFILMEVNCAILRIVQENHFCKCIT